MAGLLEMADSDGLQLVPAVIATDTTPPVVPAVGVPHQESYYLVPTALVPELIYADMGHDPQKSMLNLAGSPVIEFIPGRRQGQTLFDGRVYFDLDAELPFYPEARQHYDRLARRVRTWEQTTKFRFHVGPHTANAVRRGDTRLMHFAVPLELGPAA